MKMASSKPKHVAMFSQIVCIDKLCETEIMLLLIIGTQFGLGNFILGTLQIQKQKCSTSAIEYRMETDVQTSMRRKRLIYPPLECSHC